MRRHLLAALLSAAFAFTTILTDGGYAYADDTSTSSGTSADGSGKVVSENKCDTGSQLAKFESGGDGGYQADNKLGYIGKYQMGASALADMGYIKAGTGQYGVYNNSSWTGKDGIYNADDFKNATALQDSLEPQWQAKQWSYIPSSIKSLVGSNFAGCSSPLTQAGILNAAHLVGAGGATSFFQSGGTCGKAGQTGTNGVTLKYSTTDKSGTCALKYACGGSSCSVITTDMNKKQCDTVMPMIEAISCSNFTGESLTLCNTAKPYLMTRAECNAAEAQSKASKKGPNEEACKNQTFGPGNGSWSWVLACSFASTAVADQDGVANPSSTNGNLTTTASSSDKSGSHGGNNGGNQGAVHDPDCMNTLKASGAQFDILGTYRNGGPHNAMCIINNAVQLHGTAIPYSMLMSCDMAVAWSKFEKQAAAMGVTKFYGTGSTRPCGPMRDNTGDKPGTITNHALGLAVDMPGVFVGSHQISMAAELNPSTADGAFALKMKALSCATFRGTLSATYAKYSDMYTHFHTEWGTLNTCR